MNDTNDTHERIERILRQAHLPEPSDELKDRVTSAARQVWAQGATDIPWRIPARRLALSAAAAAILITVANHLSRFGLPESGPRYRATTPAEFPVPEASLSPLMKRQIQTGRRSSRTQAPALRRYMENIQEVLREVQDNGAGETPPSNGGGSRLLLNHSDFGICC